MTAWGRHTIIPAKQKPVLVNALSILLLVSVLAIAMFAALRSPLKDDIAWLLYVARRWMAGKELYVDLVEVNPPLIVWISAIPLMLSRWLSVTPQLAAMSFFATLVLSSAWWSASLLRTESGIFSRRVPVFAVIGAVLLIIPATDLGQREHLLVAAFLPYLIVFARSLARAENAPAPSVLSSVAVGVVAALGCALKPQYGVVFLALEVVALSHRVRPWRVAPLAAAGTLACYVGLVALLCPAYLRRAVPMALALYGATDVTFRALFMESAPLLAAEVLAAFLWWRDRRRLPHADMMMTGMVFVATSSVIFFLDRKDWFYHRLPATIVTVLILILWAASTSQFARARASWRGLTIAGLAVALFSVAAARGLRPEVEQPVEAKITAVARIESLIRLHHARTYMVFSEWIGLGFPVVNDTGVVWTSRFDSMWALKGELWRAHIDPAAAKEWPIAHWIVQDFIAGCPDIVVVDVREKPSYLDVLITAEPSFASTWSHYKKLVAFDGLKVFKRGKEGCVDPWVAADGSTSEKTIR